MKHQRGRPVDILEEYSLNTNTFLCSSCYGHAKVTQASQKCTVDGGPVRVTAWLQQRQRVQLLRCGGSGQ